MPTATAIDVFVIGASAGGLEPLKQIVRRLPADFPAAICIVVHISPQSPGHIPEILADAGLLPAAHAVDGEPLEKGRIYVAPPDHHLVIEPKHKLRLGRGPKENLFRPAIDPLFRSAAIHYDGRAAGIILSGGLDDGAAGLAAIKHLGGAAIIQAPDEAIVSSMPLAAQRATPIDYSLPADEIAEKMTRLARTHEPSARRPIMANHLEKEVRFALGETATPERLAEIADPSIYACPDCHGTLFQLRKESAPRYRCHTGHAYSRESLALALEEQAEEMLWSAVRALDEHAALLDQLGDQAAAGDSRSRGLIVRKTVRKRSAPAPLKAASEA
jgi:two-component system chemotaxis response regulator CheB